MLEIDGLDLFYGEYQALKGVSLRVAPGELVTIIGANGAGKTSTLRAIMGFARPTRPCIRFNGRDITFRPAWERARVGIGYIPEGSRVFAELTVEQNLLMGGHVLRERRAVTARMESLLDSFPLLADRRTQRAGTLSGGEQQILAIARSLVARPKFLLIDEVSNGLMPTMVQSVFGIIRRLKEEGISVLLVEQNAKQALGVADRGYLLETGQIVLEDRASRLALDPKVKAAYLGG